MFGIFQKFPFLLAGVSERKDGTMKISGDKEKDRISLENRRKFFEKFGVKESEVVNPLLSHGSEVLFVGKNEAKDYIKGFDGFVAKEKRLFLTITVADCLPVFFFDEKTGLFGLAHAGWRGIYGNILENMIGLMREKGAETKNILAGIGPGISFCHFEVKEDFLPNFKKYFSSPNVLRVANGKNFLNLKEIAKLKLMQEGLLFENIGISQECTFCQEKKYFSFRREGKENLKTMVAVIGKL
jgi:polyphenol oxidase